MSMVARLSPPFAKHVERQRVQWEPWFSAGKSGVDWIRGAIERLPREVPLVIDLLGSELVPESIAAIFFFSLEHQDRHGTLEVINLGREAYGLMRSMGAHDMPMLRVLEAESQVSVSLN